MNEYRELAKVIKNSKKNNWMGITIGTVETAPPELEVRINPKLLLRKHQLCIGEEKVKGYTRAFHAKGKIKEFTINNATYDTTSTNKIESNHSHKHDKILGNLSASEGSFEIEGSIDWTDELKVGDQVILLPTNLHSIYFILDKRYNY